jgi:hypothetical protein
VQAGAGAGEGAQAGGVADANADADADAEQPVLWHVLRDDGVEEWLDPEEMEAALVQVTREMRQRGQGCQKTRGVRSIKRRQKYQEASDVPDA